MRYRVRYQPASVILGRNVELALTATRPIPPVAAVSACVPDITGLVWIDPSTLEETDTAVIELTEVETDFDVGGPLLPQLHNIPGSNEPWQAFIQGTLCCDCEVEWVSDWEGEERPPAFIGRWDWGLLIPSGQHFGNQVDQGEGVLTVSATVTCPGGKVFEVGPITAVVTLESGS